MNRRNFLGLVAVAPIAAAVPPAYARGGWVSGANFAPGVIGETMLPAPTLPPGYEFKMRRVTMNTAHHIPTVPSIESPPTVPFVTDECRCASCVPPRRILAFTGLAGSGKSTAATHLVNVHGWQRVRFAGPLKAMLATLGLTPAQIEGDEKELPCDLLGGKTPRWAMQSLGTEWGRDLIAPDLWIRAWRASLPATGNVVVEDCRFPNEAEAVRAAGGSIIRIDRPGAGASAAGHVSEAHDIPAMITLANTATVADFLSSVDAAIRDVSCAAR